MMNDTIPAYYGKPEYVERVRAELRAMFDNKSTHAQKRYFRLILEDITVTDDDIAVHPKGEGGSSARWRAWTRRGAWVSRKL